MVNFFGQNAHGPIGIELSGRAVQMMQFTADRSQLIDSVCWDLPRSGAAESNEATACDPREAIEQARQGRKFRGRDVVACLSARELFVQNIRVPKGPAGELDGLVRQEAGSRLPFPADEADIRFVCAGEVRQGDQIRREIILMACHRPVVDRLLQVFDDVGFRSVAVDIEPAAILRAYCKQFRRDDDQTQRVMFVRLGTFNTTVVIAQGADVFFAKYINVGGDQMDRAVAEHLKLSAEEANTLRWTHGDRRADQQDPEIAESIAEATRGVIERLISELSMCTRYHNVTFRGQTIDRVILGGSDATGELVDVLGPRLDMKCQLGDPLRNFEAPLPSRRAQWDVTAGLALREATP
jgi:type IV pilus assembly protein PilM